MEVRLQHLCASLSQMVSEYSFIALDTTMQCIFSSKNSQEELISDELCIQHFQRSLQGEKTRITHPVFNLELEFVPIRDDQEKILASICKISEKQADNDIIFEMANMIPQVSWIIDENEEVLFCNKQFQEFTATTNSHPSQELIQSVLFGEDFHSFEQQLKKAVSSHHPCATECRIKRHDGKYIWHLVQIEPLKSNSRKKKHILVSCCNVHARKREEEKQLQTIETLKKTLKAADIGLWIWNPYTDHCEMDENVMNLFGISDKSKSYAGADVFVRAFPEDLSRINEQLSQTIQSGKQYDCEFRIKLDDGSIRHLAGRGNTVYDEEGKLIYLAGANWDITPRKTLEEQILKSLNWEHELSAVKQRENYERKRAEDAEKTRAQLKELIEVLFHEVRNPLNGVRSAAQILQDEIQKLNLDNSKVLLEYVEIISQCADQQKALLDEVLDFSKLESSKIHLHPTVFEFNAVIESCIRYIKPQLESKHLTLQVICAEPKLILNADAFKIKQIISNLLSNAVKYTEKGGILIQISRTQNESSQKVTVSVQDTGIGIPDHLLPILFERFTSVTDFTNARFEGVGLGLSIVKTLSSVMGATISVKSKAHQGSTFTFEFDSPLISQSELESFEKSNSLFSDQVVNTPRKRSLAGLSILIAEDNLINQKVLGKHLQNFGCNFSVANNGQEAVSLCERCSFDCILMDIEMPIMDGLEATRRIRIYEKEKSKKTPIIGISGNALKEQIETALRTGMDDYITKPFHKDDISKALVKWCS